MQDLYYLNLYVYNLHASCGLIYIQTPKWIPSCPMGLTEKERTDLKKIHLTQARSFCTGCFKKTAQTHANDFSFTSDHHIIPLRRGPSVCHHRCRAHVQTSTPGKLQFRGADLRHRSSRFEFLQQFFLWTCGEQTEKKRRAEKGVRKSMQNNKRKETSNIFLETNTLKYALCVGVLFHGVTSFHAREGGHFPPSSRP